MKFSVPSWNWVIDSKRFGRYPCPYIPAPCEETYFPVFLYVDAERYFPYINFWWYRSPVSETRVKRGNGIVFFCICSTILVQLTVWYTIQYVFQIFWIRPAIYEYELCKNLRINCNTPSMYIIIVHSYCKECSTWRPWEQIYCKYYGPRKFILQNELRSAR